MIKYGCRIHSSGNRKTRAGVFFPCRHVHRFSVRKRTPWRTFDAKFPFVWSGAEPSFTAAFPLGRPLSSRARLSVAHTKDTCQKCSRLRFLPRKRITYPPSVDGKVLRGKRKEGERADLPASHRLEITTINLV